jgi:predicted O-methyltransferase YrrM
MKLFFRLNRIEDTYNIINNTNKDKNNTITNTNINIINTITDTITNNINNLNIIKKYIKNIKNDKDLQTIKKFDKIVLDNQHYIYKLFNFDLNNWYSILSKSFEKDLYIIKFIDNGNNIEHINKDDKLYDNIVYNFISNELYEKIKNELSYKKEELLYNNRLYIIKNLFNFLKQGGNFILCLISFYNSEIIDIYYILSYMFDSIIIYSGIYIICFNFNPVIKEDTIELFFSHKNTFKEKHNLNNLLKYINDYLIYEINKYTLLKENKKSQYLELIINELLTSFKYYNKNITDTILIILNEYIIKNFKILLLENKSIDISKEIEGEIGLFIKNIINTNNYSNCLEIGMGYGIISFYILSNLKTKLISIDPEQNIKYNNYGIKLLEKLNLSKFHTLYKKNNFTILPKILIKKKYNYFDFIFINGAQTFDNSLINFFYSDLLLKINGIIIIENALDYGISKFIKYIELNYTFYKKIESPLRLAVFQKLTEDKREWNFHKKF